MRFLARLLCLRRFQLVYYFIFLVWAFSLPQDISILTFFDVSPQKIKAKGPLDDISMDKEVVDDMSSVPSVSTSELKDILDHMDSLPLAYSHLTPTSRPAEARKCAVWPGLFHLQINNDMWQFAGVGGNNIFLYSAFLDNRFHNGGGPSLRILAMIDNPSPQLRLYCQFWMDTIMGKPHFGEIEITNIWEKNSGLYQAYILTCPIPKDIVSLPPLSVSVVGLPCDNATNNLRIIYNRDSISPKNKFGVCVKPMDLQDSLSPKFVEWMEILKVMGATGVHLYHYNISPNIRKTLEYYQNQGVLSSRRITLPGFLATSLGLVRDLLMYSEGTPHFHSIQQNEQIAINDCFYRNMYRYEYLLMLDVDEMIVPREQNNWQHLLETVDNLLPQGGNYSTGSYCFENVYFASEMNPDKGTSEVPEFLNILQKTNRTRSYFWPGYSIKCFQKTDRVLRASNHKPKGCLKNVKCVSRAVNMTLAAKHHYRSKCKEITWPEPVNLPPCDPSDIVSDPVIWRWRDEIVEQSVATLLKLGLLVK